MSLNGLEATEVLDAYQSALSEGGGWFLLKYTGRDKVELLAHGSGGLVEVQEAVDLYLEQSPLYGFIHYRRRKVVLKYIPDGTSRLLQARVSVHFSGIIEQFAPYDTIFAFTKSSDLRDSTLSSACLLHTASNSIKSSGDPPQQHALTEITEDGESQAGDRKEVKFTGDLASSKEKTRSSADSETRPEDVNGLTSAHYVHNRSPSDTTKTPQRPRTASNTDKALPAIPQDILRESTNPVTDTDTRSKGDGRMSSQSARPSTRDVDAAYDYQPKVKLGPRPSIDSTIRLDMAGANDLRPVSTLPAGLRMPQRKVLPSRPSSRQAQTGFLDKLQSRESPPVVPMTPIQIPSRKSSTTSSGRLTPAKTPEPKSPKMTPEKQRLMKALELRKKQMAARKAARSSLDIESAPADPEPELVDSGIDGSILSAIADASEPVAESELVPAGDSQNVENSPVSIPETSDGPSTQASSITDEEEITTQQTLESRKSTDDPVSNPQVPESASDGDNACSFAVTGLHSSTQRCSHHSADSTSSTLEITASLMQPFSPLPEPDLAADQDQDQIQGNQRQFERNPQLYNSAVNLSSQSFQSSINEGRSQSEQEAQPEENSRGPSSTNLDTVPGNTEEPPGRPGTDNAEKDYPNQLQFSPSSRPAGDGNGSETGVGGVALSSLDEDEEIHLKPEHAPVSTKSSAESSWPETEIHWVDRQDRPPSQDSNTATAQPPISDAIGQMQADLHEARCATTDGGKRMPSLEHSDEQFLLDDSFMEELKSATVQEAKPISVSKTPLKPLFSKSEFEHKLVNTANSSRSVSTPVNQKSNEEFLSPQLTTPGPSRSFSAAGPRRSGTQQSTVPLPKKVGVSSGISQRIRALEQLSSRPSSPSAPVSPSNTSAFINFRKTSLQTQQEASDPQQKQNERRRPNSVYPSSSSSPEAVNAKSFNSLNKAILSHPESISVTATIVRDTQDRLPEETLNPSEPRHMDLRESPLIVERQTMGPPPPPSPHKMSRPNYSRYSSARSGSISSPEHKSERPQTTRRGSLASMRSRSSRGGSEAELPRTISDSSLSGITSLDGTTEEKKGSRRSRLLKRMSSMSSMSRRSIAHALSPGPKEVPIIERQEPTIQTQSSFVDVGDVNIQFPDTLLWKRRHMVIDEHGILVLSASKSDNNSKIITKKYPLSQFRQPYIPDQDRQELPNSVFLDFSDGSTLQCACEHVQGQVSLLQTLQQAHASHQFS